MKEVKLPLPTEYDTLQIHNCVCGGEPRLSDFTTWGWSSAAIHISCQSCGIQMVESTHNEGYSDVNQNSMTRDVIRKWNNTMKVPKEQKEIISGHKQENEFIDCLFDVSRDGEIVENHTVRVCAKILSYEEREYVNYPQDAHKLIKVCLLINKTFAKEIDHLFPRIPVPDFKNEIYIPTQYAESFNMMYNNILIKDCIIKTVVIDGDNISISFDGLI